MKDRIFYIDLLKTFGIILVVLGHVYHKPDNLFYFIYSFHMPLFFLLSGVFFDYERPLKELLVKRWKTLILPYLFFYLATYLYWVCIEQNLRADNGGVQAAWYNPILGLLYESPYWNLFPHNNPLWFIPTLLSIEIIACLCALVTKKIRLLVGILGILISTFLAANHILLPFGLLMAFCCITFFFLGSELLKINSISKTKQVLLFIICFVSVMSLVYLRGYATDFTLFAPSIKDVFKFYLIALLTITGFVALSKIVESFFTKRNRLQKVISYIGANTLIILCLHDPIKRMIIFIYSKVMGYEIEYIRSTFLNSMICLVLIFMIMLPCIWGYNKYIKLQLYKL